jgi:C4-dicarboxylate-binding protein DctP
MKFRFALAVLGSALLLVSSIALAQQPIVIKFSHVVAVDTPKGHAAEYFKKLPRSAPRAASGRSLSQQLALQGRREMEALQLGSATGTLAREIRPSVRNSRCSTCRASSTTTPSCTRSPGPVGAALFEAGQQASSASPLGQRLQVMSANKPLRSPADYKGQKVYQSSKVLGVMKALGAIPQVMAFSEVYQALQTGVVDSTENPPSISIRRRCAGRSS